MKEQLEEEEEEKERKAYSLEASFFVRGFLSINNENSLCCEDCEESSKIKTRN
jgi:hypothetical protein